MPYQTLRVPPLGGQDNRGHRPNPLPVPQQARQVHNRQLQELRPLNYSRLGPRGLPHGSIRIFQEARWDRQERGQRKGRPQPNPVYNRQWASPPPN